MIVLRGTTYDIVKATGKWVLPIALAVLPVIELFMRNGDFSAVAYVSLAIAVLTVLSNLLQTASKKAYKIEQEENGEY